MPEIKAFPTPGFQYKVKPGEYINHIAGKAYGDNSKWPIISEANERNVKGPDKGTGGDQQWFFPGDIIFIPEIQELKKFKVKDYLPNKDIYEATLIIEETELKFQSMRLVRTLDTVADGATFVIAWEPFKDYTIDEITSPYGYQDCQVYIGGNLQLNGTLYNVKHTSRKSGREKELEIFSSTADLIDSTPVAPYEISNQSLLQIAKARCRPFGINVEAEYDESSDKKFRRTTAEKTESVFSHLAGLAKQRGALLSSTAQGDLLITSANVDSIPVGTIEEKLPQAQEFEMKFNGRGRFNMYKAVSQTPKKRGVSDIAVDTVVRKPRRLTFNNDAMSSGELPDTAKWRKNKTLAEALEIPFPVTDWYGPDGNLWEVNTLVTVVSPTIGIEKGFTFLIRQVEFILEAQERTAVLGLVPPNVYTKEDIEEPWLK